MAAKRPQRPTSRAPSAADRDVGAAPYTHGGAEGLRPSDIPGVWLNRFNIPCDEDGVSLSFKAVKARDRAHLVEVMEDAATDSPAQYLKAVAVDPRFPTAVRVDAAKAAAPYFDRKQPQALDGGLDATGAPVPLLDTSKLSGLSTEELTALRALLAKVGAPGVTS